MAAGIENGTYSLVAMVDPADVVSEADEENNYSVKQIQITSTGIEVMPQEPRLAIYPNPAKDWTILKVDGQGVSEGIVNVYDELGRYVEGILIEQAMPWEVKLDIRTWDAGVYWVVLRTREKIYHSKFVVN